MWGLASPLFVANARTGRQFVWSVIMGLLLMASYFVTARISILAVVIGIGVVHIAASPIFFYMSFRIIELRFFDYFKSIAPAGVLAAVMAGLVWATRIIGETRGWGNLVQILLGVSTGVVVYLALVLALKPPGFGPLQRLLNTRVLSAKLPLARRVVRS